MIITIPSGQAQLETKDLSLPFYIEVSWVGSHDPIHRGILKAGQGQCFCPTAEDHAQNPHGEIKGLMQHLQPTPGTYVDEL
jgi:hypothetical protein